MADFGSAKDAALVSALAAGASQAEAAQLSGLSERTVSRRVADPEFRRRVEAARDGLVKRTIARLSATGILAAQGLHDLLKSPSDAIKLGACRATLDFLFKGHEQLALIDRVAALEELAKEGKR